MPAQVNTLASPLSASPPVWRPIGNDPNRCAYIWLNPHGSNRIDAGELFDDVPIPRQCQESTDPTFAPHR